MNEDLSSHRKNVSRYLNQCLYNYQRWFKASPKTKRSLLKDYCSRIREVTPDYEQHLKHFVAMNKDLLRPQRTVRTTKVNIDEKLLESCKEEQSSAPQPCPEKSTISRPIKKFSALCGQVLAKTLTYLVSETNYENETEVARALLANPKFHQFLADYANDFYLDLLEDEII